MKTDKICKKWAKKKTKSSLDTWLEDDVFVISGDSKSLLFLSKLIKAQAKEKKDDNFCIGYKHAGKIFFSKKSKYGILIHNQDSKK